MGGTSDSPSAALRVTQARSAERSPSLSQWRTTCSRRSSGGRSWPPGVSGSGGQRLLLPGRRELLHDAAAVEPHVLAAHEAVLELPDVQQPEGDSAAFAGEA